MFLFFLLLLLMMMPLMMMMMMMIMMLAMPPFGECNVQCFLGACSRSSLPDSATSSILVVQVPNSQIFKITIYPVTSPRPPPPYHHFPCPFFARLRETSAKSKKIRNFRRLFFCSSFFVCVSVCVCVCVPNIDLDEGLSA